MSSVKGVSVVICCFNSAAKIKPTLAHLTRQMMAPNVQFEVVLVDNNCTDDTIAQAQAFWVAAEISVPLRVVKQSLPGLNYARKKGIAFSSYDYIVLCDDDNWLCNDYLIKIYRHFEHMPTVAIIGGAGIPELETPAPSWFNTVKGFGYAVGSEGRATGYVDSVYGAGMALRKIVFEQLASCEADFILTDRKGNQLSSGGDTEICMMAQKRGWRIYFDESLTFNHFINKERLEWDYYLRLRKGFGISSAYLTSYYGNEHMFSWQGYLKMIISTARFLLGNLRFYFSATARRQVKYAAFIQNYTMRKTMLVKRNELLRLYKKLHTTKK